MKKSLLLLTAMLASILFYGQIPTTNLSKSYLFTGGSLQNTINPGIKDLIKTGTASTLVPSNYLIADDAIALNGDYLNGGTSAGNTNLSVSFWIKTSTNDATSRAIFSQYNAIESFGVKCTLKNGKVIFGGSFKQSSNASAFNSVASLNSIADGRWHHIVVTGVKVTQSVVVGQPAPNYFRYAMYVDNVLQGTAENSPSIYIISLLDNATPFIIGNDNSLVGDPYEDMIDDIRFYERGLTVAEIQNLYYDNIAEGIIYVNKSATGANNGTTWADAFTDLQTALSTYVPKKTIWVAAGRYTPHGSNRKATFLLPNALKMYGGFNGTETDITQRDPQAHATILSGDLSGNDNGNVIVTEATRQDNSFHVVTLKGNVKDIIVDGFTISDGNASGGNDLSCATAPASQFNDQRGAAITAFPHVTGQAITALFRNCVLEKNTAYSVAVTASMLPCGITGLSTDLDFESCIVRYNHSRDLAAFLFSGNSSYQLYSKGSIVNSLFHDNISVNGSSSVHMVASASNGGTALGIDVQIVNSTFAGNSGASGNVLTMQAVANTVIRNSIIHGNGSNTPFAIITSGSTVQSTIVEGGQLGGIDADPLFKNIALNDFALTCGSPAINAGNDSNIALPFDLAGGNRKEATVDLGAFEFVSFSAITAISKNISIPLDASGNASIEATDVNDGSGAVCGVEFTLSIDKSDFTCADLGDNIITLTATEVTGGAFSSIPATVTIIDTYDPVAVVKNITVQLDANGSATIAASDVNNASYDNCTSGAELNLSINRTNFTGENLGINEVPLTVTDAKGNESTAVATVTVEDNLAPAALAQNIALALNVNGTASVLPSQINNGSSDNSTANQNLIMTLSKTSFTCDDLGDNVVTFTVEDESGNNTSTTAVVTISDDLAPTVITQDIAIVLDNNGNASITTESINNGSIDNCTDPGQLTISLDRTTFTRDDIGLVTVTLTVEDLNGNSSQSTATVIVSEKLHQTIQLEPIADVNYGTSNITVTGVTSSELPISYSVSGPATLVENTLIITGIGSVTIQASQSGNEDYYPAPDAELTFEVSPAVLVVTADSKTKIYGEVTPTLTYQYQGFVNGESSSVLVSSPAIATEADANSDAGIYPITVSGGLATNYTFAYVSGSLTINKADQSVSISNIPTKASTDSPFEIDAVATSGLPLSYEVNGPASLSGSTITLNGTPGQVTVTATQEGNVNFNSASESISFAVKDHQTITFSPIDDQIFEDGMISVTASSTSNLPVSFEIVSGPATFGENSILFDDIGTVVVRASQAGSDIYLPATPVEQSFEIITITGIEKNTIKAALYPNPAEDIINIEIEDRSQNMITLCSLDGKELMQINRPGKVDISNLKKGLYLIKIYAHGKTSTFKFFKK